MSLPIAALICSFILDRHLWGVSLDFICISRSTIEQVGDRYREHSFHFIFDLKDMYIWICIILFLLHVILLIIDYFKLDKAERKELDKHFINRIKSVFRLKSKKGID